MDCNSFLPNGLVECKVPLAEVKRVIICDKDVSFSGLSDVYNVATWRGFINDTLEMFVTPGQTSYEVTTDDPNVLTTAEGQKYVTNQPAPSALVYLDSNWCDYSDLLANLKGGMYGVIYELKNGMIYLKRNPADGTFRPFPARLTAINKGIPLAGDIANNFPVHIHHTDYHDFMKAALIAPAWSMEELILAMPVGVSMVITTPYASGDVVVYVTERCGEGVEDLTASDFEVLGSNYLADAAVTAATDDGDGYYTLTIQKDTPAANLADGDYVIIRVNLIDTVTTHLSNRLTVEG